jgi:hypothetical protein
MALPGVCDDPVIVGAGIHEVALAHESALAGEPGLPSRTAS